MLKIHFFTSPPPTITDGCLESGPFPFDFFFSALRTWWGSALWENSPGHAPAPKGHFATGILFFDTKRKLMCLANKGEEKEKGWGEKSASGVGLGLVVFFFSFFLILNGIICSSEVVCFTVWHKAASCFLLLYHNFLIKTDLFSLVCVLVSLSLSALITCRMRLWAEGSAGPPTLIWCGHVCVFMYCSPLVLRSCFATNDLVCVP